MHLFRSRQSDVEAKGITSPYRSERSSTNGSRPSSRLLNIHTRTAQHTTTQRSPIVTSALPRTATVFSGLTDGGTPSGLVNVTRAVLLRSPLSTSAWVTVYVPKHTTGWSCGQKPEWVRWDEIVRWAAQGRKAASKTIVDCDIALHFSSLHN